MKKLFTFILLLILVSLLPAQNQVRGINQALEEGYAPTIEKTNFATVKWEETFDSATPPAGWTVVDNDGSGAALAYSDTIFFSSGNVLPQAGQYFWFSSWQNANASGLIDEWLISPQLPMIAAGDSLHFYAGAIDGGFDDSLKVYVSTTDANPASFTEIAYFKVDGPIGSWFLYSFDLSAFAGNQIYVAVNYYVFDGGGAGSSSDNVWVDHFIVTDNSVISTITVAEAREDLDMDLVPDRLGDTVTVQAMVISPNYQTTNHSYYISDGTAGITTFLAGTTTPELALGDIGYVTGVIGQFNGLTQLQPLEEASFVFISAGNPVPDPPVLTLAQYKANPEMYEGSLVGFMNLSKVGGTWPASGSSATLQVSDGTDTVDLRIDSDTDIDGSPEPVWPIDIIGLGSQYDSSVPYDGGYQIIPRYYADDFLPAGSLPVELTSFSASVAGNAIVLNWATATETNNLGFEVERATSEKVWKKVGFVEGYGTSSEAKSYSFTDKEVGSLVNYFYRLKQVDFDGTYSYSAEIEISLELPTSFELSQNFPNPFNPTTNIRFTLPEASNVKLKVFNTLGEEVANLTNRMFEAGVHNVSFDASNFISGVYFYSIEANNFVQVRKMMLLK